MNVLLVVLLVLAGVALLVVEMFLIPGFGVAGVAGFASLVGSVVLAYMRLGVTAGHIVLAASVVLSGLAVYVFFRSRALQKMALDSKIDSHVELADPGKKIAELKKDNDK